MILQDETIRQTSSSGEPLVDLLQRQGIIPGIKVDEGAKPLAGSPGELITEGLDGLRDRLEEYRELGARFAKWRAVIIIDEGLPTATCVARERARARALRRALPGAGPRPDRRARGADGRAAHASSAARR